MAFFTDRWPWLYARTDVRLLKNKLIVLNLKIQIVFIEENADVDKIQQQHQISAENVIVLKEK